MKMVIVVVEQMEKLRRRGEETRCCDELHISTTFTVQTVASIRSFVSLFVHQGWLGCWRSMWHASSHRQRWGLELTQCAAPLTLGLVLYILRAQLSLRVSPARFQWCGPVLQVEPLAPVICYPRWQLSPHPDPPIPGVMACHILRRGHRRTLCTCPRI